MASMGLYPKPLHLQCPKVQESESFLLRIEARQDEQRREAVMDQRGPKESRVWGSGLSSFRLRCRVCRSSKP